MNSESTQGFLLSNIGAPFLTGLVLGFIAKKALKFAVFLAGIAVGGLLVAEFYGYPTITDETVKTTTDFVASNFKHVMVFLKERLGHLMSKGGSAIVGFAIGLKLG